MSGAWTAEDYIRLGMPVPESLGGPPQGAVAPAQAVQAVQRVVSHEEQEEARRRRGLAEALRGGLGGVVGGR